MAAKRKSNKVPDSGTSIALPSNSRGRIRVEGAVFPTPPAISTLPKDYLEVLAELKRKIIDSQSKAALSVNTNMIALYWHIGGTIVLRQTISGWGNSVVERLAFDLQQHFPRHDGFSPRNIWRMRAFFLAWSGGPQKLTQAVSETKIRLALKKLTQAVSEIPWGQNIVLLQQLKDPAERLWYAEQTRRNGWSRAALQEQIAKKAHARQGKATTNFSRALPVTQAELAQLTLKDPYTFDFLTMGREAHERVMERDLLAHIREFLLELGSGFAFIGNQVKLTVGGTDYFIDLLFYHLRLRCHVVVELKTTPFKPEYAGKLNFYLSAVDDLLKHKDDQPTIGLLLCSSRNQMQVEYALRDIQKPIGVAGWETKLVEKLPGNFQGSLPTVEEIEAELNRPITKGHVS
ncbi:MAG: PDDEXK nuclease domain-containing protein [Fibrobacterota bacterium]